MHDTPLGWAIYLKNLERQATPRRPPRLPVDKPGSAALAALGAVAAALARRLRTAVDSGGAHG